MRIVDFNKLRDDEQDRVARKVKKDELIQSLAVLTIATLLGLSVLAVLLWFAKDAIGYYFK